MILDPESVAWEDEKYNHRIAVIGMEVSLRVKKCNHVLVLFLADVSVKGGMDREENVEIQIKLIKFDRL